jgi:hypothetical protein
VIEEHVTIYRRKEGSIKPKKNLVKLEARFQKKLQNQTDRTVQDLGFIQRNRIEKAEKLHKSSTSNQCHSELPVI